MASTPSPPNPYQQAAAQQSAELGASQGSSIINNPNEKNPYGSVNYTNSGYETIYDAQGKAQYVPRYTRTTELSPDQQKLLGLQTQTQYNMGQTGVEQSKKMRELLGTAYDPSKAQGWAGMSTEPVDRAKMEEALMGRYRENAGKSNAAEDAQLAARGLSPGSGQYAKIADTRARALTDASQQAYLASGAESREQANFLNSLRQGQVSEGLAMRNQPINELSALMGGSQVTLPEFSPMSRQGINAAPVGSYIGQNYANAANAAAQKNAGIFGLGSALIGGVAGI